MKSVLTTIRILCRNSWKVRSTNRPWKTTISTPLPLDITTWPCLNAAWVDQMPPIDDLERIPYIIPQKFSLWSVEAWSLCLHIYPPVVVDPHWLASLFQILGSSFSDCIDSPAPLDTCYHWACSSSTTLIFDTLDILAFGGCARLMNCSSLYKARFAL